MFIKLIATKERRGREGKWERLVEKEDVSRRGKKTREDMGMNVVKDTIRTRIKYQYVNCCVYQQKGKAARLFLTLAIYRTNLLF